MGWSETQEKALREGYTLPKEDLLQLFPKKTWSAIRGKIYRLGLNRRDVRMLG